ncbi:hypothetical protein LJB87_01775 [Alistipes sp. OttesenSCG-928-L06]|nr:hypothetical protein [Alistipes sp. OttesenSCG-928-L06]
MYRTAPFVRLGQTIESILTEHPALVDALVRLARADNPWFTADSVRLALSALSEKMLRREKLDAWLRDYPIPANFSPKNVGIVMAGNIPLVGFLDLLCVCVAGHRAYVKTSSKDKALMQRAIGALKAFDRTIVVEPLTDDSPLNAVIATGSNNTNRYFKSRYGNIPHLLRGSRTSVAVLTGDESAAELCGLSHDVFDYFGMGCRNVGKLFVPDGYNFSPLIEAFQKRQIAHPNYRNAYRHHKALLCMRQTEFLDGGFFTLRENAGFSEALPDLVYSTYTSPDEINAWLAFNDDAIQCIVGKAVEHPRRVDFGQAQHPELWDYPDGKDVMAFLHSL